MGNTTLPTPVFLAGGALCLLAGYLVGTVSGHSSRGGTATVVSYDASTSRLCLNGDAVKDEKAVDADGVLCGVWSHSAGVTTPDKGDRFRFVTQDTGGVKGSVPRTGTLIYGTVVAN